MHRRIGFVLSLCGIAFTAMSLTTVLRQPDFVVCVVGFGFTIVGIFFAIESVARKKDQRS